VAVDGSWNEWQNHVLAELKRLSDNIDKLNDAYISHREQCSIEIAKLKIKAGIWGGVVGAVPALVAALTALIWWLLSVRTPPVQLP